MPLFTCFLVPVQHSRPNYVFQNMLNAQWSTIVAQNSKCCSCSNCSQRWKLWRINALKDLFAFCVFHLTHHERWSVFASLLQRGTSSFVECWTVWSSYRRFANQKACSPAIPGACGNGTKTLCHAGMPYVNVLRWWSASATGWQIWPSVFSAHLERFPLVLWHGNWLAFWQLSFFKFTFPSQALLCLLYIPISMPENICSTTWLTQPSFTK